MADLNGAVRGLNRIAGFSEEEADAPLWTRGEDGQNRAMVGRYTLQGAYGGYQLTQIINEGGGVRSLTGYGTKREVYHLIHAYREGMAAGRGDDRYTLEALRANIPAYRAEREAYAVRVAEVAR
jgi:hypothetical protein